MEDSLFYLTTAAFYAIVFTILRYVITDVKRANGGLPIAPGKFLGASFGVVICTIGFSAAWGGSGALYAAAFSAGLVLGIIHPVAAVALLVSNAILRPWELDGLAALSVIPKLTGGLCAFSWLFHGIRKKTLTVLWNTPTRLFCALAIWILISAMFSGDFDAGLQDYNNTFLIAAIIFMMVLNIVSDAPAVRVVSKVIVISVLGAMLTALVMTLGRPDFDPAIHRLYSFGLLGNSNDLASLIVLAIPLACVPVLMPGKGRRSALGILGMLVALAIFLPALWLSQSRGAMAGVFVAGGILFLARSQRPVKALLYSMLALPFGAVAISLMNLARQQGDLAESTQSRFNYLVAGLNMALHNPIMGVGFGNYPKFFESYAPSGGMEFEWGERTAHSTWVLALAENGFVGFFLIAALFVLVLKAAWRERVDFPELLSSLIGYGVAMSFLSHTYTFFPYLLFALVLAAAKIEKKPPASTSLQEVPV